MIVWRVLPVDPAAADDAAGGPLWFPREYQGAARHDNPAAYGCLYVAEGPVSAAYAAKFHEAVKHLMRTDHIISTTHITINEKAYQDLGPDLQEMITGCAKDAVAWARNQAQNETEEVLGKMGTGGATVHKFDTGLFRAKSEAAVAEMEKDGAWRGGLWKEIQDTK